ncbi:outer membrane beta-barrel protein [Granulicella tundricola]|uniref:TonB-dependent receptor plug n=1 Tax=Granulicella tundricola (strain ATCC BAA-1859 / DSM 23138 / MP5ACTX9) TaxID=1198114 RepID=E8WZ07_GRATM|nr:carboxypeptidase regulatory-like domain-containing protein [Granulicella tundricola]ADW69922.1 TonB-dependent receptor plug [Granulicella tundricola MP5ACTX9]
MILNDRRSRLLFLASTPIIAVSSMMAQSNYGAVRGIVTDVSGSIVSKAEVTITSEATKLTRTTTANGSGEYVFNAVDPGKYTVSVSGSGFMKTDETGVVVDSGNTIALDLKLRIGSANDSIEVSGATPIVDNGTSYNGQLIDAQKLQNLPNPGRNPFLFSKLDNNVTAVGDPRFVRFQDQSGSSTISIAGAPLSSNNYSIDGVPITDFSNRAVIIPSIEAVEEVKVQANTYDAEIGRTSGGMFNTSLRAGSSTLHGVLQGETRQTNWGANLFFNNRTPTTVNGVLLPQTPRGAAEFYSYVGAIGGPIPLPHILGGNNKTFFWIAEEGYRQRSPLTASNAFIVPTVLQRSGNFSEIGTVTGSGAAAVCASGICIKDPLTGQYFTNNTITASRINPVGQALVNAYPQPNTSITAYGTPNFNGQDTLGDRADEFDGKVSHEFSTRWLAEFYYLHYGSKEPGGNALTTAAGSSSSYLLYRKVDAIGIQNTITITPTTLLTVGFGFNRFPNNTLDISNGFNQSTLGFPANYAAAISKPAFPEITTDSGLSQEGTANSGPAVYFSRNFVVGLSKSLGKHSLKTGYVYRAISLSFTNIANGNGVFAFDKTLSGATAADMLLGYPTSGSLVIPAPLAITTAYQATYLQDDYRVTPKLTLNLGIRYEYEPGVHERSNHYSVGFDRNATYNAFNSGVTAKGGVEFAGQNGYPTSTGNMGSKWSPRAGFAYGLTPMTVIKGGAGVFYAPIVYSSTPALAPGYVVTNSIASQTGVPTISLSNPFPNLQTKATGNSNGLSTGIGSTLNVIDQSRRAPLYESYSLALEQQFAGGIALKIAYVGGHARNFYNGENINQLPDSQYALGTALSTKVTNKYAGLGSFGTGLVNTYQTLLPFPQFQSITDSISNARSDYNSLDVKIQKNFSKGVTILAAYTWSSNWDNIWGGSSSSTLNPGNNGPQDVYNISNEYSRSINDIPQRFTVALTYELPFGKGKQFLSGANRLVDAVVGGWRFNDITIVQNGSPLPLTQSTNFNSSLGNLTQRPTINPGIISACYTGSPESRISSSVNRPYFNPKGFTTTPAYAYGNQPRTSNCYGPGYLNSDLSLNKDFKLTERIHAEFRAEALNAFNTPEFNAPNVAVDSSSAGQITGTLGFPRLIQLGGRLTF